MYRIISKYTFLVQMVLFCGLFVLPAVFWPYSPVQFEVPRVVFFNIWSTVLLIVVIPIALHKGLGALKESLIYILIGYLGVVFLASFLGVHFGKSWEGNYYRLDGIVTLLHLFIFAVIIGSRLINSLWKTVSLSISLGSVLVSAWVLVDAYRFFILKDLSVSMFPPGMAASFGQPNFLGGYLGVTLPFTFYWLQHRPSPGWIFGIMIQVVATALSFSLGGALAIVVAGVLIWYFFTKKSLWKNIFLLTCLIIAVLGAVIFYFRTEPTVNNFAGRQRIFTKMFLGFTKRPILGYGWANADKAFEAVDWPIKYYHDIYVDKAHSSLLEALVTTGVLGFALYVILIGSVGWQLYTRSQLSGEEGKIHKILLISFIVYCIHAQTNVISINEELVFWLCVGFALKKGHSLTNLEPRAGIEPAV